MGEISKEIEDICDILDGISVVGWRDEDKQSNSVFKLMEISKQLKEKEMICYKVKLCLPTGMDNRLYIVKDIKELAEKLPENDDFHRVMNIECVGDVFQENSEQDA